MTLRLEPLDKKSHDRKSFDCGLERVNEFLRREARKQMDKKINRTWVLVDDEPTNVMKCAAFVLTAVTPTSDAAPAVSDPVLIHLVSVPSDDKI